MRLFGRKWMWNLGLGIEAAIGHAVHVHTLLPVIHRIDPHILFDLGAGPCRVERRDSNERDVFELLETRERSARIRRFHGAVSDTCIVYLANWCASDARWMLQYDFVVPFPQDFAFAIGGDGLLQVRKDSEYSRVWKIAGGAEVPMLERLLLAESCISKVVFHSPT